MNQGTDMGSCSFDECSENAIRTTQTVLGPKPFCSRHAWIVAEIDHAGEATARQIIDALIAGGHYAPADSGWESYAHDLEARLAVVGERAEVAEAELKAALLSIEDSEALRVQVEAAEARVAELEAQTSDVDAVLPPWEPHHETGCIGRIPTIENLVNDRGNLEFARAWGARAEADVVKEAARGDAAVALLRALFNTNLSDGAEPDFFEAMEAVRAFLEAEGER